MFCILQFPVFPFWLEIIRREFNPTKRYSLVARFKFKHILTNNLHNPAALVPKEVWIKKGFSHFRVWTVGWQNNSRIQILVRSADTCQMVFISTPSGSGLSSCLQISIFPMPTRHAFLVLIHSLLTKRLFILPSIPRLFRHILVAIFY